MPCFPFISSTNSHFLLFRFPGEVLGSDFENQPHTIFPLGTVGQVNSSEFYYVLAGGGREGCHSKSSFHLPNSYPATIHSGDVDWVLIVI